MPDDFGFAIQQGEAKDKFKAAQGQQGCDQYEEGGAKHFFELAGELALAKSIPQHGEQ